MDRRQFIGAASAASVLGLASGCATPTGGAGGKVVVVGGGYGGATAAKYIRMWSEGRVEVTLVEPNDAFVSCPLSNLVLGGSRTLADITVGYQGLRELGVVVLTDEVASIDTARKKVVLTKIADDKTAMRGFHALSKLEGIIPALESAHAVGYALQEPESLGDLAIINISGRGDKDLATVMDYENI